MNQERTEIIACPGPTEDKPQMAIVKHGKDGSFRAWHQVLTMSVERGEAFGMTESYQDEQGSWKKRKRYSITALGYDRCNLVMGISFHTPQTILGEGGIILPNPSIIRDKISGGIDTIRIHMIAAGRAHLGNWMVHDLTLSYDLRTYFGQDLWSKWSPKWAKTMQDWGKTFPTGVDPKLEGNWHGYPMSTGVTLWVDLCNKDVLDVLGEHHSRQKFAERNARTIARRNLMKPFIARTKLDASLTVPVVGWMQVDFNLEEFAKRARDAKDKPFTAPDGERAEFVESHIVEHEQEEVDAALAGESEDETAQMEPVPPTTAVDPTPQTSNGGEMNAIRARIRAAIKNISTETVDEILGAIGLEGMKEVGVCGTQSLLEKAASELEKESQRVEKDQKMTSAKA